ncbi:MAG: hypothetical protein ACHQ5A_02905 [Opitutales bacterium]
MKLWPKILIGAGVAGILIGSLDPMEGSVLILAGSGLVALGTYVGQGERSHIRYWTSIFILNAIGVGEMFELSAFGGIGGTSGRSLWWGVLILPYVAGWFMALAHILTRLILAIGHHLRGRKNSPAT